jgi:GTP-binding protein
MFRPKGGPDGGNGGRGGDVVLEADHDLNNLNAQYFQPRLLAENGQHGLGKGMDGRAGGDLIVKVPPGTLVWRKLGAGHGHEQPGAAPRSRRAMELPVISASAHGRSILPPAGRTEAAPAEPAGPSPGRWPEDAAFAGQRRSVPLGELVVDLTAPGQRFVLCQGGRGGLGNRNFATARRQTPRFAQPGEPGEAGEFILELRLLADAGLVGYPNAGKSTLLKAISQARPRIAPYPFTTLRPQVGTVEYRDWQRVTVCDVPGLVEGAHRDVGLGHRFLRHVERCRLLVLVLDMAGTDGRQPWDDYRHLLEELALYDPALMEKPRLVVANKMDQVAAQANLRSLRRRLAGTRVLRLAAAFGVGVEEFKRRLRQAFRL